MKYLLASAMVFFSTQISAMDETSYKVSFENAAHHEARISATFTDIEGDTLRVRMSRSSPGRYALHEFAKNVYSVSAVDSTGKKLQISRPNPYAWDITGFKGDVTVTYTLFADRADGTYSQVDRTHAHLNIPATFMWAVGHKNRPVTVSFKPFNENWKVATQLPKTDDPYAFTAPNLYYFMDSPIELSNHSVREWVINGKTLKLAVHHNGTEDEMDEYAAQAEAVTNAQKAIYGDVPDFDYGEYVFIACYMPQVNGDGMEHRNSTIITSTASLKRANYAQIGTLSHEFFHAWNVERIRPKSLEPFDFTKANMSEALWFAEGFTSYYGPLTIKRAGLTTVDDFINNLSGFLNYSVNVTGRLYKSPEESSKMAAFTDAGTSIDRDNFTNIFFSYYTYGQSVALALDLKIRADYKGKSLDGFMQKMWVDYGQPEKPYTRDDLIATLGEYLGDKKFANRFFSQYIVGKEIPNYAELVKPAGLMITHPRKEEAYIGNFQITFKDGVGTVGSQMKVNLPIYQSGLERNDKIISLNGTAIKSEEDWRAAVATLEIGVQAEVTYISNGATITGHVTPISDPTIQLSRIPAEAATPAQKAFLSAWLGD